MKEKIDYLEEIKALNQKLDYCKKCINEINGSIRSLERSIDRNNRRPIRWGSAPIGSPENIAAYSGGLGPRPIRD